MAALDASNGRPPSRDALRGSTGVYFDDTTSYTYDAENRLTGLQSGSSVIGTYAYDGAGDRYTKTAAGVTTAYTLDLASSLPQVLTETAGSSVTTYAYGAGPLELDKSGTTYWYLTDTLGSVRLVTDSTGATPATYAYTAFGSTRKSTGTLANEVRFTGERTDTESGLEFLRARTYDPSTGTFLQRDTWGITPTSSQSLDAYCYTANDPANATDHSGHMRDARDDGHIGQSRVSAYTAPITSSGGQTNPPSPTTPKSASGSCQVTRDLMDCTHNSAFDQAASAVLTADEAAQAGADSAWGSLWRGYYAETAKTLMERYPGMSLEKADQIAYNLARMNIAKGGGAFLSDLSRKLGVAGAGVDAMLTFADCQKGLGPCLLKSSVHFGTGMAGVVVGGAVVEACVEFAWTGPWGCAGAGLIAGGVTTLGLNAVTDTVIDIYLPDQPQAAPEPHP